MKATGVILLALLLSGCGSDVRFLDLWLTRDQQGERLVRADRFAEAAEEGIYEWDIANDKFFASPRLTVLLGVKSKESGRRDWSWEDRIHPDDIGRYNASLAAHRSGQSPRWDCEYRFQDQDSHYRWISDHGTSIRDQASCIIAAYSLISY